MLIGIDGNEANVENRVGVNVYAYELLHALAKSQNEWGKKHHLIVYLKNPPLLDLPKPSDVLSYKVLPGQGLWILTRLMPHLFMGSPRPDIIFSPSHYVPVFSPIPAVCSIMDVGYLENSAQFRKSVFWQLRYWTAISILVSKRVIAISTSTKNDIVRHYPFAASRVAVTHLGFDAARFTPAIPKEDVRRIKERYSIVGDYVLFLSTLKPSKNVEGLLDAFSLISAKRDIKLVIAGKKGWMYDSIFAKVQKLGLTDQVIFTDFVSEDDKPALFAGARVFVLPSFWEGFGLDLLNAMACGVPVVASRVGSIPEVVGEAGVLVDPANANSIRAGLESVLSAPASKYNKMVEAGINQVKKFSWEKTASKTLEVLEEAYEK